jgi:hypothetical protein
MPIRITKRRVHVDGVNVAYLFGFAVKKVVANDVALAF